MVREGVSPWMIDNVAQNAGMILGPLTMADVTSLGLLVDIFESLAIHQRGAARYAAESVKSSDNSSIARAWARKPEPVFTTTTRPRSVSIGLSWVPFAPATYPPVPTEIEWRLFVIQTIEALHAMREGIIEDAAMANLASVLGWSYPAGRGGVMDYIDFIGRDEFERVCRRLQEKFGDRFAMPG